MTMSDGPRGRIAPCKASEQEAASKSAANAGRPQTFADPPREVDPGASTIGAVHPNDGERGNPGRPGHSGLRRTPLARRTPMPRRSAPIAATPRLRAAQRHRARIWDDARGKVTAEGRCRVCGEPAGGPVLLEAAHILGRKYDRPRTTGAPLWVNPDHIVPLCRVLYGTRGGNCHPRYDAHALPLWSHLTEPERAEAIALAGSEAAALRRTNGRNAA